MRGAAPKRLTFGRAIEIACVYLALNRCVLITRAHSCFCYRGPDGASLYTSASQKYGTNLRRPPCPPCLNSSCHTEENINITNMALAARPALGLLEPLDSPLFLSRKVQQQDATPDSMSSSITPSTSEPSEPELVVVTVSQGQPCVTGVSHHSATFTWPELDGKLPSGSPRYALELQQVGVAKRPDTRRRPLHTVE